MKLDTDSDLEWLLRCMLKSHTSDIPKETRSGKRHYYAKNCVGDSRKSVPKGIREFAKTQGLDIPEKMQLTWVVCYLNDIFPDKTQEEWRFHECSHLCISYGLPPETECISSGCLCWESKPTNQARGHCSDLCMKKCTHCPNYLCICQKLHTPWCI